MYHPVHESWSTLRALFDSAAIGTPAFRDRATSLFEAAWPRLLLEQRRAALFGHGPDAVAALVAEPGTPLRGLLAAWRVADPQTASLALELGIARPGVLATVLPRPRVAALVACAWPRLSAPFGHPLAPGVSWVVFVTGAGVELVDLALGDADAWSPRAVIEARGEFTREMEGA